MELRRDHMFDPFTAGTGSDSSDSQTGGLDYNDPSTIAQFIGPNHKLPAFRSPADVRSEASVRSRELIASYKTLREILRRHEATIQNRWTKKRKQKRLEVLNAAWPGMVGVHRPDFDAFRKIPKLQQSMSAKFRERFVWPYINQEDLLKSKTLLLLLNSRGRFHPSEFAAVDGEAMHLGRVTESLMPIFLNEHVMILNGVQSDEEYGKLIAWEDHPDAFDWMQTGKQLLPGEGLLILEAQQRLLEFLVKCCEQILHEIPTSDLTSEAFPYQQEPCLKMEADSMGFASLATLSADAPYRVPSRIDFDRIVSLLQALASAAEDHLLALREDPAYFERHVFEIREHRQEMLKDVNGNEHPARRPGRETIFWSRVIGTVLIEAYFEIEIYSELRKQADNLRSLHAKYLSRIAPTLDLPEEFLAAILKFRHYLNQATKGPLRQLKEGVVASPPMRRFFVREPPLDPNSTKIQVRSKTNLKMSKVEGELMWLLRTLWEDGRSLFLISLPLAMNELERLVQAEPEARELLSAHIAAVIGGLSIISQCSYQLELFRPWAAEFETVAAEQGEDIQKEYSQWSQPLAKLMGALDSKNLIQPARLGELSDGRFHYPAEKRRTKENIEALRRAERNLDEFWNSVDSILRPREGVAVKRLELRNRNLQRTPEWIEPPVVPKAKERASVNENEGAFPSSTNLSQRVEERQKGTSSKQSLPVRVKVKTKGAPHKTITTTADTNIEATAEKVKIPVDARAFKVFRTLFFDPSITSSPGEISWGDFIHAMVSVGFAAEKLYGSVWQFQNLEGPDQSRIQFHEPHPHPKIPFIIARRHGRRLHRAFGWDVTSFILRDKRGVDC